MRIGPIVSSLIGEGGLLTEEKVNYVLEHQGLQIVEDLFAKDALVMEHDQAHEVSLIAPNGNPYVTVAFEAPLFGIWAPKGGKAPFVCIEPWYGRCDRTNFQKKLEEREWGNTLASGETFEASYTITICYETGIAYTADRNSICPPLNEYVRETPKKPVFFTDIFDTGNSPTSQSIRLPGG